MTAPLRVLLLNGPNLNLLGTREPHVYGSETLAEIEARLQARAATLGVELECRQTNSEGQLIDWLQEARGAFGAVILNPAALTHYSIAVRDAVAAIPVPVYEVHISNIHAREPWRDHSVISAVAAGVLVGLGSFGYDLALEAAVREQRR